MPESRRIAFRFSKEFSEKQFKEMQQYFGFQDESDTIRRLMAIGYTQIKYKAENIEKAKKMMDALGISSKDLIT